MNVVKIEELECRYYPRYYPDKKIKCSCGATMRQFEGPGFFPQIAYCQYCDAYKYGEVK